jgi:hypothetical protein
MTARKLIPPLKGEVRRGYESCESFIAFKTSPSPSFKEGKNNSNEINPSSL